MTIPTGPFPAPIEWADILPGMRIRFTGSYSDGESSTVAESVVVSKSASAITATPGWSVDRDGNSGDWTGLAFTSTTYELLQAFTGDTTEPTANSVVQGSDGTVYQRQPDPADPTNSVWVPMGSTTATTWSAITAAGAPTLLLDGSTQ